MSLLTQTNIWIYFWSFLRFGKGPLFRLRNILCGQWGELVLLSKVYSHFSTWIHFHESVTVTVSQLLTHKNVKHSWWNLNYLLFQLLRIDFFKNRMWKIIVAGLQTPCDTFHFQWNSDEQSYYSYEKKAGLRIEKRLQTVMTGKKEPWARGMSDPTLPMGKKTVGRGFFKEFQRGAWVFLKRFFFKHQWKHCIART